MPDQLKKPDIDPTPIFEHFRGSYGSQLLTAAVSHLNVFGCLATGAMLFDDLRDAIELQQRPAVVLITALRAMGFVEKDDDGLLQLTPVAREHLVPGSTFDVGNYVGLAASSPGVLEMVERLRTNKPASGDGGTAFIYRDGVASAMESEQLARHFTLALAGRAKNVAPHLADAAPMNGNEVLLDVAGGTGIYAIAFLREHPGKKAIIMDRPEVLKVAAEYAQQYEVADRLKLLEGDMFQDALPVADVVLLSNVLHDWDVPENRQLIRRCADALPSGDRLLIHDVYLNDELDGPLPIALYSAALFTLTEGRAYSAAEYRQWLEESHFSVQPGPVSTLVHCGVLTGVKG